MRGGDKRTGELFSYVDLEKRVRSDHPLRAIRGLVNEALVALEHEFFGLYAPIGRPSIPPEKLLRAMLLQALYSIRSERQLMERLEYDLLFRWFVENRGRCCRVGPFGVLKEPRPAARREYRREVPGGGSGSAAGEEAAFHRPLHGRRDADRSVGFVEEL